MSRGEYKKLPKKESSFLCSDKMIISLKEARKILGKKDSEIDIAIFDEKLCPETIGNLSLFSPKLPYPLLLLPNILRYIHLSHLS